MSIQLGTCTRLRSRISQLQCDKNRKGSPAHGPKPAVAPCFACQGCSGLVNVEAVEYQPPPKQQPPPIAPLIPERVSLHVPWDVRDDEPTMQTANTLINVEATQKHVSRQAAPAPLQPPVKAKPALPPPSTGQRAYRRKTAQQQAVWDVPPWITAQILGRVQILMQKRV